MNYLHTLDRLSFTKVVSIAIFMAILFALPVAVYLIQHQTRINTRAAYERPKLVTERKTVNGPVPQKPPVLGRVYPWVGKIGDVVWIQGQNFGTNPLDKQLKIGGVVVPDDQIAAWEDTLIQAVIPEAAVQGGIVEIRIGSHPVARSLPYILYDQNTAIKLHLRNGVITAENGAPINRALLWIGDDVMPAEQYVTDIQPAQSGETTVFNVKNMPILTLILLNQKGQILPYYVDPVEWGF